MASSRKSKQYYEALDAFGKMLMAARDAGIEAARDVLAGSSLPLLKEHFRPLGDLEEKSRDLIVLLCSRSIDDALHQLLFEIERARDFGPLRPTICMGKVDISDPPDELRSYLHGPEGWFVTLSKEGSSFNPDLDGDLPEGFFD